MGFSIPIKTVAIDILHLDVDPKSDVNGSSFNVRCPFCGDRSSGYHMNIDNTKDVFRCVKCSGDDSNLGALTLYARVKYGITPGTREERQNMFWNLKSDTGEGDYDMPVDRHPQKTETEPASDELLDAAYSAMLKLPYLHLTEEHKENLRKRGLDKTAIKRNGYASSSTAWVRQHPDYRKAENIYYNRRMDVLVRKDTTFDKLKRVPDDMIIGGLLIANDLLKQHIKLKNIPGFFKIAHRWCVKMEIGMLIPTRNMHGQIVGIQTRRDVKFKDGLRYMTMSSKGLPDGVTTKISRVHFPLHNESLTENATVFLTEGPLKADIASELMPQASCFMAIPGVNNTRELDAIAEILKQNGIKTVMNALDMDRLTNIDVAKAAETIRNKFKKYGIDFRSIVWDQEYIRQKEMELHELCKSNNIQWREKRSNTAEILENAKILLQNGIDSFDYVLQATEDGSIIRIKRCWRDETKGIDDWLLFYKNNIAS